MTDNKAYEVSFLRGKRDYVRAIDALAVAPINAGDLKYRIRFHQLAKVPVHWVPAPTGGQDIELLAELKITGPEGSKPWVLTPNEGVNELHILPNIEFSLSEPTHCEMEEFEIMLLADLPFWEQLVAAVKIWGDRKYPHLVWSVVGGSGSVECFRRIKEPAQLRMKALQGRMGMHSIGYALGSAFTGKLMVASFPKEGFEQPSPA